MNDLMWIILGTMSAMVISITVIGFLLLRKKRTILRVLHPDRSVESKSFYGGVSKTNKVGEHTYRYDSDAEIKGFWGNSVWYYLGNPNPIIFNPKKNLAIVDSKELTSVIESDLAIKLFQTENLDKIIMILVIVTMIGVIGLIALNFISEGSTIADNEKNRVLLNEIVINAIRGGK